MSRISALVNIRKSVFLLLLAAACPADAEVTYVVNGLDETLTANVLSHVDTVQFGPRARLRPRDHDKVIGRAIADARAALRPYGYYAPDISARIIQKEDRSAIVELTIEAGPPIRVASVDVSLVGPGATDRPISAWLRAWPLGEGAILDQSIWEYEKQHATEIANSRGYLAAEFTEHELALDLEQNTATLTLIFDTGPRYVMGDVEYSGHDLKPGILEYIPRFEKGDPYTARLVSRLRTDLWKTGYFDDVTVLETERPDLQPPAVDFDVRVATKTKNHYSGALGWGDDTGIRLQANYSRHPMSSNGDRVDVGIGYQELDDQFTIRTRYRKPWIGRSRQWWDAEFTLRFENQDLEVKRDEEDEDFILLANGDLDERHIRFGRLKLRNLRGGEAQRFTTPFVQFLNSDQRFDLVDLTPDDPTTRVEDPVLEGRLRTIENAFSIGMDYEVVDVQGRSFETFGRRDRAWIFHSNKAFGSTVEFTQLYAATRRSFLLGDRLKFHVRGEIGYTDAIVDEFVLDIGDQPLNLSFTRLPNFYRFKAGGSMSVRGYGFEQLSNNDIGSNHIITASAEAEYRFLGSWSGAAFADIGNAFNEWDDPDLKRGIGIGIRWYSFAGEIRVDVARAIDFEGKPLRYHLTIGTPLL
jgi:translocation and assembly module TamA